MGNEAVWQTEVDEALTDYKSRKLDPRAAFHKLRRLGLTRDEAHDHMDAVDEAGAQP